VEAESASLGAVLEALRAGRFYASSGLALADYRASAGELALELVEPARIELVGAGGLVLEVVDGTEARFEPSAYRSPYLRVRATDATGRKLWTQPLFL
jgi:hypothetical protein